MSKPYKDVDFSDQVAQDRNWRIKEISDLKSAIFKADDALKKVLLRALVAICYAHWEGSVRFAAQKHLEHVALRNLQYSKLDRQFLRHHFLPRLDALSASRMSIAQRCKVIDDILSSLDHRFTRANHELVNTRSNLNFDVFSDICLVCGVSGDYFEDQKVFIDVVLLKRRNAIAHGEEVLVDATDLEMLTTTTVNMMRNFGDALENNIYLRRYSAA